MDRKQTITLHDVKQALTLPEFDGFKAQLGMSPAGRERLQPNPEKPPRQSAVLVLIFPKVGEGLHVILTKRTDSLRGHSGQVSFPGGSVDPEDTSYEDTALRETREELGINTKQVHILGQLSKMWIPPSNFDVVPIVATVNHEPLMTPNPFEVAKVLHLSLDNLVDDGIKRVTKMDVRGGTMDVPYYDVEEHIVWGATAGMLCEFEQRLKAVLNQKITEDKK